MPANHLAPDAVSRKRSNSGGASSLPSSLSTDPLLVPAASSLATWRLRADFDSLIPMPTICLTSLEPRGQMSLPLSRHCCCCPTINLVLAGFRWIIPVLRYTMGVGVKKLQGEGAQLISIADKFEPDPACKKCKILHAKEQRLERT